MGSGTLTTNGRWGREQTGRWPASSLLPTPPLPHLPIRRCGLTLIEGLVASSVLAIAVVGIIGPIAASYKHSAAAESTSLAVGLAGQLLEEISSKPFVDPSDQSVTLGPEANEVSAGRAAFDNIDDYHLYADSTDGSSGVRIKALDGSTLDLARRGVVRRNVRVEYRASPSGGAVAQGDFALVTVTVTPAAGPQVVARKLFCKYPRSN
jgi:hypothetical protein